MGMETTSHPRFVPPDEDSSVAGRPRAMGTGAAATTAQHATPRHTKTSAVLGGGGEWG